MNCIECGREIDDGEDRIETDSGFVCPDCSDKYVKCDACGEWYKECDTYLTHDYEHICVDCYSYHYARCNDCGEIYSNDDLEEGSDGEYYCSDCIDSHRFQEGVLGYHDFDGTYSGRYMSNEDDRLFMGVELECDYGTFRFDDFHKWTNDGDLIHFEHDGSLSEDEGVECITMPCTLAYHQNEMDWSGICKTFSRQGFSSHNTDDCGMHVHLSRNQLSVLQIVKMDIWLNRWLLWRDIARRESIYSGRYNDHKLADIGHAVYGSHFYRGKIVEKYACKGYNDRYQPLNTCNPCTVEVRIFRGTLCAETIIGTLEALHAMVKFADAVSIKQVYGRNLPLQFVKFMAERTDRYPHVMPMLDRLLRRSSAKEHTPAEMLGIVAKANTKRNDSREEQ